MAVNLSPIWGAGAQLLDNSGNVLSGGKIYTYAAGTTTQVATYTSNTGVTANSNPIVLNSAGRVPYEIWLLDGQNYKFVLKDSNDVLIGTWDNLSGINSNFIAYTNQQEIQTATAGQTVFNLTTMQYLTGTNSLSVFVDGVNQYGPGAQYAYTETDSTTVTFASGLHVGAEVKFTSSQIQNSGVADASQISYTYPAIDAVTESVEEKLAQTVSVKDFGAVGDGVTDDTVAIQNAIDAVSFVVVGFYGEFTGKSLYFPAGVYKLTTPLVVQSNAGVSFVGDGKTKSTIFQSTADTDIFQMSGNNYRGVFNGIRFTGPQGQIAGPSKAINIQTNGNQIYVQDCWFNTVGYAIYGYPTSDSNFLNNVFEFVRVPFYLAGSGNGYFNISENVFYDCGPVSLGSSEQNPSFVFDTTNNVVMSGNRFVFDTPLSPQSNGYFSLTNANGFVFSNNVFSGSGITAKTFVMSTVTNTKFVNNVFAGAWKEQFDMTSCGDILISGNTIPGAITPGSQSNNLINVNNCSRVNVSNNELGISTQYGIYVSNSSSNVNIVNNTVQSGTYLNAYAYIYLTSTSNAVIKGNIFYLDTSTAQDIQLSGSSTDVIITDNVLDNGIYVDQNASSVNMFGNVGAVSFWNSLPTTGTWKVGEKVWYTAPTAGSYVGAVCVTAGTPGTWKAFGAIAS